MFDVVQESVNNVLMIKKKTSLVLVCVHFVVSEILMLACFGISFLDDFENTMLLHHL